MLGLEEEDGESVASDGSLLELNGMSGTTYGGEAGGVATRVAGTVGGGGDAGVCHMQRDGKIWNLKVKS